MAMEPIEQWWTRVDVEAKQWLREHSGAGDLPESVQSAIAGAGGPSGEDPLGDEDWQFIELQSETPD
ncbi:hypothetical protein [Arthrobacter burdickii]|uniref:hypothetical protein n=1 Tax=Arthrobacter burdickii TaxID=3035920 RepID=UPI003F4D975C